MMNTPAFPNVDIEGCIHQGMSLRDYFAGQALQGMLVNGFQPNIVAQPGNSADYDYTKAAYRLADFMLIERNRTP